MYRSWLKELMGWKLINSTWNKVPSTCAPCLRKEGVDKEGCGCGGLFIQRQAYIHVPFLVNNSWGSCAELKVCHGCWGLLPREMLPGCIYIWWLDVMGRGSLEAEEEGGSRGHNVVLSPTGGFFHPFGHWRAGVNPGGITSVWLKTPLAPGE